MKLLHKDDNRVVFHLSKREKDNLLALLKLYPALGPSFQPLNRAGDPAAFRADQELLEQALAEQKEQNRAFLNKLLAHPQRFADAKNGCRLTLEAEEVEWFLQVLNEIRVGKWHAAGCPDEQEGKPLEINVENLHHLWAMEIAGAFQWQMIEALDELGY